MTGRRTPATLATMTVGAACVAPSVWINVEQQLALGGSHALLAGATLSVLIAAACPIVMRKAWAKRDGGMAAAALVIFVVCLGWNLTNAIGAASIARDSFAGGREASTARVAMLRSQLSQAQTTRSQLSQAAAGRTPATASIAACSTSISGVMPLPSMRRPSGM